VNWLDFLILAVVAVSLIGSILKGFTREVVSLVALVAGVVVALWWYPIPARRLEPYTSGPAVAGFVGFGVILLAFLILGWMVSKLLAKLIKASGMRWFDRLLGAAFGLVRGLVMAAVIVLAMVAFAPAKSSFQTVDQSLFAPAVLQGAKVIVVLGPRKLREGFENGLQRVREVWRESRSDTV